MKKIYIVTLLLLPLFKTNAQYVLTPEHNLTPGDIIQSYTAVDTLAQQGNGGVCSSWDFSNIAFTSSATILNFVPPNNTPYNYLSNYATASYLRDNTWYYSKYTNYGYSEEGAGNENIEDSYTNNKRYFTYPFAYNSISTDTFEGNRNGATTGNINGTITTKADGHGKIKLPYSRKEINDVLRIRIYEHEIIAIRGQIMNYYTETFQWFAKEQKCPLFSISRTTTVIKNKSTGEIYTTKSKSVMMNLMKTVTEVKEPMEQLAKLSLFPNPAVNEVSVKFNYMPKSTATIDLVDITGKIVRSFNTGDLSSSNDIYKLNIINYPKGTYFVRVVADKGVDVQKLIIQ